MMKTRLCILFAAALLTCAGASAQKGDDLAGAKVRKVTLVSQHRRADHKRSVFNFQHGVRGDKVSDRAPRIISLRGLPDNTGLTRQSVSGPGHDVQATSDQYRRSSENAPVGRQGEYPEQEVQWSKERTRFDLRFGGVTLYGSNDWFEVADRAGSQSVIKDLGALRWEEMTEAPLLAPHPTPHAPGIVFRRGRLVSPQNVFARAVAGHMYLLRVKRGKTDYQVLFRVESLDPSGECALTWKRFPTPGS